jgi:hypothetical protein
MSEGLTPVLVSATPAAVNPMPSEHILSVTTPKVLGSSRPRRPGAKPPHGIRRFRGDPGGAEAGVKGPGAASSRINGCASPCATLSLAPAADVAKYLADLRVVTLL